MHATRRPLAIVEAPCNVLAQVQGVGLAGQATRADIEALGVERGHRTLAIICKGGKKAVIPLGPRTARAIDLAIGERCEGPIFLTACGARRRDLIQALILHRHRHTERSRVERRVMRGFFASQARTSACLWVA